MQIIPVTYNDAAVLLGLSKKTFFDAFARLNNAADMEAYAAKAFTLQKFQNELNNPDSRFYFAVVDDAVAGYLKINLHTAQTDLQDPNALEIERIYVLQEYQGQRIGNKLLDFAIEMAIDKKYNYIWLGVWEHNAGAIRLYESKGFKTFSSHPFVLGKDEQTDLLMRRELF